MSTVVVAEKPSVARDLARVLGARTRGEGCLRGNGYVVTWALGHLVHLAEPDDYGPPWNGRWSLAYLPMIPSEWRLRSEHKTAAQLRVVEGLLNAPDTDEIVVATDAGREGELIFRLIHQHARCRRPFRRLWISSLTDQAIAEGFRRLQPGAVFDDLAAAARARAQADWLVGMNLTRAYTVRQGVLCTLGRVQTPTLAMLVAREREITAFQVTTYYELVAHLAEGFDARYRRDGKTRIDSRVEAEELHRRLSPEQHAVVESVDQEIRRHRPPPFHSLVDLQREANRRYGFTAAQTLQHAQSLYESLKLITYPRTESRHLPEDMEPRLPRILESLPHPQAAVALERLRSGHRLGRTHVDQTRLTDHHAIVPTGTRPPETLSPPLQRIFDLVASRFVAAFLPDQVVEETAVVLRIGGEEFFARGERVLDEGWTVADAPRADRPAKRPRRGAAESDAAEESTKESDDQGQALPPLTVGQRLGVA
ncbi:MAG: DNA topoisomerase, partial [Candidatus Latescibacterota bacterium]